MARCSPQGVHHSDQLNTEELCHFSLYWPTKDYPIMVNILSQTSSNVDVHFDNKEKKGTYCMRFPVWHTTQPKVKQIVPLKKDKKEMTTYTLHTQNHGVYVGEGHEGHSVAAGRAVKAYCAQR